MGHQGHPRIRRAPRRRPRSRFEMDPLISTACAGWLRSRSKEKPFLLMASLMQPHDICYWCINPKELVTSGVPVALDPARLPELPPNHRSRPKAPAILEKLAYKQFTTDEQWRYYLYAYYRMVEMLDLSMSAACCRLWKRRANWNLRWSSSRRTTAKGPEAPHGEMETISGKQAKVPAGVSRVRADSGKVIAIALTWSARWTSCQNA